MSTTIYYDNIQKLLFRYADLVEQSNSLGLSNETVNAENLFCEFLNKAFGWKLINGNEDVRNQDTLSLMFILFKGDFLLIKYVITSFSATSLAEDVAYYEE